MTEVFIFGGLAVIIILAFMAFMDRSGQPPEEKNEEPQVLTEDDFNGDA